MHMYRLLLSGKEVSSSRILSLHSSASDITQIFISLHLGLTSSRRGAVMSCCGRRGAESP